MCFVSTLPTLTMKTAVVFLCLIYSFETDGFRQTKLSNLNIFKEMSNPTFVDTEVENKLKKEQADNKLQDELNEMKNEFGKYQKDQNSKTENITDQLSKIKESMTKLEERTTSYETHLESTRTQLLPKKDIRNEFDLLNQLNTKLSNALEKNSEELERQRSTIESLETSVNFLKGEQQDACKNVFSLGYKYDRAADFCYKVHQTPRTWEAAYEVCQTEGGCLAKVDTQLKIGIVTKIMREDLDDIDFYLGATDKEEDGEWRWVVDNSVLPDFHMRGPKSCLEVDEEELKLDDSGCNDSEQKFICEMRKKT